MAETETVRDVMTTDPLALEASATARDAANAMREADVGSIPITDGGKLTGLVTDRDIVVRTVADGRNPEEVRLDEIATDEVISLSPGDSVSDAIGTMREHNIRRLPVADDGDLVGIVSLGDLAVDRDRGSVLADISAAPPNN